MSTNVSKEIVKQDNLQLNDMMSLAKAFAESGMFPDMKSQAMCIVKIQAGQELGIPPFAAMTGIHIIQGKPTVGANLIASRIKASGKYDYKTLHLDDNACSLDFYEGKTKIGNSTFTIADARKAQTKNLDKFPKNMLFARAISNGSKWFCPDIFTGPVYTEGEIEDVPYEIMPTTSPISEPAKDTPPMTDMDKLCRTATQSIEDIIYIIDNATTAAQLRTFLAVNGSFFKTNPEMKERLVSKGNELKASEAAATNNQNSNQQ